MIGPARPPISPLGSVGHKCIPNARSTLGSCDSTPSSTIRFAPAPPSSAGWNTSRTVPGGRRLSCWSPASRRAAPRSIDVCASWPHACILPCTWLWKGTAVSSSKGRASMSARSRMQGPCPSPISATTPNPPGPGKCSCRVLTPHPVLWRIPNDVRVSHTKALVSFSLYMSSGFLCSVRLKSIVHFSTSGDDATEYSSLNEGKLALS
mmetsp:Transcript_30403/g.61893  ORF Transcript_30403/g.61893 Transcript_30403/m.61893 type:complete len:207 (+) Transcript_30403:995-1615(+)